MSPKQPNGRLAALVEEAGVSHKGLAKRIRDMAAREGHELRTTHAYVSRWLNGGGIEPPADKFLVMALSEKLGRRLEPEDVGIPSRPSARLETTAYPESLNDGLEVLAELARYDSEGTAGSLLTLADDGIASSAFTWVMSYPDDLSAVAARNATRVGRRDVLAVQTAAQMFLRLDFLFGGGHGRKALRHYFRHEVLPLLRGSYTSIVGTELFAAATEVSELLGYSAYDIGDHALAHRYFLSTLRLTQATDDRVTGARVLASMSHQANYLGRYPLAARLAKAAQDGSRGKATPRTMAMFAVHEARALANLGDENGCTKALLKAEKYFAKSQGITDPEWLSYFDEAELLGEACHCFRDLKRPALAVEYAERAVEGTDPSFTRTLAFCQMVLAASQRQQGELEQAIDTASLVVNDPELPQSLRVLRYIQDFQRDLSDHRNHPTVVQFNADVARALETADLDQ